MASEITENEDEIPSSSSIQEKEAEKTRIRQIIDYQKSLYFSSSSSSASCSSFSSRAASTSSSKSSRLLDLMREGSAPLRRLFDMEHTSLEKHFKEYSGSPLIRPVFLWGSDTDGDQHDHHHDHHDPWAGFEKTQTPRFWEDEWRLSSRGSCDNGEIQERVRLGKQRRRKLHRTQSYKRLPRFSLWRCGRFRFKLRLIRFRLGVLIRRRV